MLKVVIEAPHVFTDGQWLWTADTLYFVEKYHIEPPADFVKRMEPLQWRCPPVDNQREIVMAEWQN